MYREEKLSRTAGWMNIIAAILLVLVVILFIATLYTISSSPSESSSESSSGSSESTSETEEQKDEKKDDVAGIIVSVLFLFPLILVTGVPTAAINVIWGLVFGVRYLNDSPGRVSVVFSLIFKIVTIPVMIYCNYLVYAFTAIVGTTASTLCPLLFTLYLILLIVTHVFEWKACNAARY